jgi:hypothetical protein
LADRYHEILAYRKEGLKKYGVLQPSDLGGPPAKIVFPKLSFSQPESESVKIGPVWFSQNPPIFHYASKVLGSRTQGTCSILELGPGNGTLASSILSKFGNRVSAYYGLDRDQTVSGRYERIDSITPDLSIDLFIASEVIEHMPPDDFYDGFLVPIARQMKRDGVAIIGTPNALSPGSIFRDFTHVQGYTWYDLYSILRTLFTTVQVYRTRYVWSPQRLLWLLPSMLVSRTIELDWCDGLIFTAMTPSNQARSPATVSLPL